jgi:hypothetical protein
MPASLRNDSSVREKSSYDRLWAELGCTKATLISTPERRPRILTEWMG